MINKILQWAGYERKESATFQSIITLGLGTAIWTDRDYEALAKAGYKTNSDAYACINLIAGSAKQVPWIVYRKQYGAEVNPDHPLVKLLHRPNPRMDGAEFIEACVGFILLSGNRYIERVNPGAGNNPKDAPLELYPLRPDRMRILLGSVINPISGYRYTVNGRKTDFDPWEICHQKLFNPLDDWYGLSPLEAAGYPIDIGNEASNLYKKLLQKGYPAGVIKPASGWGDTQIAAFRKGLRQREKDNDWLLLEGDAEVQPFGFKPADASLIDAKKWSKRDIGAVFRVPAEMIGDAQAKTYANYQEARRSLYTEAVIPALTHLRDGLNNWLGPLFGDAYIDFDKDSIDALAEDREVTSNRVTMLWTSGLIKQNEGRSELKYEEVPEGDRYYFEAASASLGANAPALPATDGSEPEEEEPEAEAAGLIAAYDLKAAYELKAWNLVSEEQKANYWKSFERTRAGWYRRVGAMVASRFNSERKDVLLAYRDAGEAQALRAVDAQGEAWDNLYRTIYFGVAEDFGRRVLAGIKMQGYSEQKFEDDIYSATLRMWLASEGAKRVVAVMDTTKEKIRYELRTGVEQGEGIFELSKRLQGMYSDFSNVRAERISRTEVLSASNLGSQTAARSTNLPLEKEWIATPDGRTRDAHSFANGQRRMLDEPYEIFGARLMYPGDSSLGAPSDQTIQCRCTEGYSVKRA